MVTVQIHKMMTSMREKIALELLLDLLGAYGPLQFTWPHRKKCLPVFAESIYWYYIWIIDPSSSNPQQNRQMLDGSSIQEIAEKIYTAFKRSCWLESTVRNGKKIVVELDTKIGKSEEFMIKYDLLCTSC